MNKKCPKCGYAIQDGDRFCINCGYKISQNNKEKLKSMKNEKTGDNSTKSKKQPIKRMVYIWYKQDLNSGTLNRWLIWI